MSNPRGEGRYVVHTDRQGLNRLHGGIVVVHTLVLIGILALLFLVVSLVRGSVSGLALLPFGILVVGQCLQVALHAYAWGARSALSEPMIIEPPGFTMVTAAGALRVPWPVVTSVSFRRVLLGRVMSVSLRPDFTAAGPPPGTFFNARQWRYVQRRGLLLGERGLVENLDDIAGAMSYFAGRPLSAGLAHR